VTRIQLAIRVPPLPPAQIEKPVTGDHSTAPLVLFVAALHGVGRIGRPDVNDGHAYEAVPLHVRPNS
jgi:hypothetical protein